MRVVEVEVELQAEIELSHDGSQIGGEEGQAAIVTIRVLQCVCVLHDTDSRGSEHSEWIGGEGAG